MKKTFLLIGLASFAFSTMAQDNLLANPQKGLYIKVEGGKTTKVLIR